MTQFPSAKARRRDDAAQIKIKKRENTRRALETMQEFNELMKRIGL